MRCVTSRSAAPAWRDILIQLAVLAAMAVGLVVIGTWGLRRSLTPRLGLVSRGWPLAGLASAPGSGSSSVMSRKS